MAQSAAEQPRSGARTPVRSSRRSHPNIQQLSLAPLSAQFQGEAATADIRPRSPHSSYIQPKTAPTTPGILSRSSSRHRHAGHVHYVHDDYFTRPMSPDGINKSKSDAALHSDIAYYPRHHRRKHTAPPGSIVNVSNTSRKLTTPKQHTRETPSDWLYRAGLAIASETRESKGQSWLTRRESSTSLVRDGHGSDDDDDDDNDHREDSVGVGIGSPAGAGSGRPSRSHSTFFADDEYSPVTPKSRGGSRTGSAFNSRRGSRVGSRVELRGLTGLTSRPPGDSVEDGYLADQHHHHHHHQGIPLEPDFVESDEEGLGDEEEVARLAQEGGFGGWMERLIGWSLFDVEEDGEETDDEEQQQQVTEQELYPGEEDVKRRREEELRRRREERARIQAASSAAKERKELPQPGQGEGEGGWQDAAWLLSVASKVLL
ncbi:ornithine mitochondrial [Diplodia corticola]|uniref:Ornithine mitochondrial n=1 Tax=Diplodia corticola TaxID=236234 RepID=A0A1J9RN62_9PEZI|nr:ornithine mitochondrial [Diplodia corticola]OJD29935.1 ornithine mitochondrial [Diplodia corticola]